MSKQSSWIDEAWDELEGFLKRCDLLPEELKQFISDNGQRNLLRDAGKTAYATVKSGDGMTPLKFGGIFGHWETQFRKRAEGDEALNGLVQIKAMAERFAEIRKTPSLPPALIFVCDAILSILPSVSPELILKARDHLPEFYEVCRRIRVLADSQPLTVQNEFQKGYGAAIAANTMGPDGVAIERDRKAEFMMMLRPRVIEAGMNAAQFQSILDLLLGQSATGDSESFSRFLRRRDAAVAEKGRPRKKPTTLPNTDFEKPDNV